MRFLLLLLLAGAATACRYRFDADGADRDGDGFGAEIDCDDDDDEVGPGVPEVPYNGVDDDCDEATPDDDLDGDGHPAGSDCDDADPLRHPDATEVCNGLDDDCDEVADDAVAGQWFVDADGDGYGDPATASTTCAPGSGLVDLGGDCDDDDDTIHPDAEEDCDAVDRDCDGFPDRGVPLDAVGASVWYADADGDGFGDAAARLSACTKPEGFVADDTDCDDTAGSGAGIRPGAIETCDGVDENCDGLGDVGAVDLAAFFLDDDGDGFGDPDVVVVACDAPEGYVTDSTDCDDLDALTKPGAAEVCDGKSNDCDLSVDEGAIDRAPFYPDLDGDGFGDSDAAPVLACAAPVDHVANDLDCDDNATDGEDAFPGGFEVCDDGLDNDCDGVVDNAFDALPWYADSDDDGWGNAADVVWACAEPAGYVDLPFDCDDSLLGAAVNPDADEVCNAKDDDCNGFVDDIAQGNTDKTGGTRYYLDADGDGYSDEAVFRDACAIPPGYVPDAVAVDCDETDPDVNPGEASQCDGLDRNCDGFVDGDGDHDGFPGGTDCPAAPDCDDANAAVFPGVAGCSGGASCLEILETWEDWGFSIDDVGAEPLTWTIDGATSGTREVVCDLVGTQGREGPGWTRVYHQDFTSGADGWQLSRAWDLSGSTAATRSTTACAGRAVLGPYHQDPLAILYKSVDPVGVPHSHAWLNMTMILVDDWETSDAAYAVLEDRTVWYETALLDSSGDGDGEVCDNVFADNTGDLIVDVSQGILHENAVASPSLFVAGIGDGSSTDEGIAIDDVAVWVK